MSPSDQYADGPADVWEFYVGSRDVRTANYKEWLINVLKINSGRDVLDVACGTGVDSVLLLEAGFSVTSTDASDQMLKYALRKRWSRRKEEAFDSWEIEEANWLSLHQDLARLRLKTKYDAVICLGNSFSNLIDVIGDGTRHRKALQNFYDVLRPGGILIIDHRNFDMALDTGNVPSRNVYYNSNCLVNIDTTVVTRNGRPQSFSLHYTMAVPDNDVVDDDIKIYREAVGLDYHKNSKKSSFSLTYHPHRLNDFSRLLTEAFGPTSRHQIYADFEPFSPTKQIPHDAGFFIHVIEKPSTLPSDTMK